MLVFSHKMVFIENEAALLCVIMWERASSVQLFDIAFAIKKFSFCGALFKRILVWKRDIPKGSSLYEIFPFLLVFHLPYSKYKGAKICFYPCRYQNQNCSLVSHLCRSSSTLVASVALVLHSCHSSRSRVARVWHSCCKLD